MRLKAISLALLPLLLLAVLAPPVHAQGIIFTETFDNPLGDGWEYSGDVLVKDGLLRISPGNMVFRLGAWQYPTIRVRLLYTAPGEVLLHYHASENGSYGLHLGNEGIWLEKVVQGTPSTLARPEGVQMPSGEWAEIQIAYDGNEHQISLDGTIILTATDGAPLAPGSIGFLVHGENAADLDNLSLSAMGGPSPAVPPLGQLTPGPVLQPTAVPTPVSGGGTGWNGVLGDTFSVPGSLVDLRDFLINLGLAAALALVLGQAYTHWGASLSNRRKFATNLILIAVTTTFIIMVVRSSVALSLGLVGALSIVRFRTAIKEPEELAYLFLSVGLGIGLGDNQRVITILALAAAIILIGLMRVLRRPQADVNLHLTVACHNPHKIDLDQMMQALQPHCPKLKLLRFDENEKTMEASFLVELRKTTDLNAARAAIRELSESAEITFLDNRGIW